MSPSVPIGIAGIDLVPLTASDALEYRAVLHRNAHHLGSDYHDELALTAAQMRDALAEGRSDPPLRFGIRDGDILIGRIDLVPVDPPRFGLGYWVDEAHTRIGVATASIRAVLEHAATLGATDVFAGVTHGNVASERALEKNGFARVESFECYDRFHRTVGDGART